MGRLSCGCDGWALVGGARVGASEDAFVVGVIGLEETDVVWCGPLEELEHNRMMC